MKYILVALLCGVSISSFAQGTKDDWANLSKYEKQNAALSPPAAGATRVVFLGSSIIEFWQSLDSAYFAKRHYIDRGISGQLSPQLLIRFREDVIDLKPQAVIILAGSNDIAHDTSVATYRRVMDNIQSMVELARQNNIKVFLCTYVPIADYPWRRGLHPASKIIALNKMITAYGKKKNITILDYFTPLVNKENGQRADLTRDGVHPNLKGYQALEVVTDKSIHKWEQSDGRL